VKGYTFTPEVAAGENMMTINSINNGAKPQLPTAGKRADVPAAKAPTEAPAVEVVKKQVEVTSDADQAESRREQALRQAAQSVARNFFAVSDSKFSIYKDGSGQYITRITSLRDGRVVYIPEPELLQQMARAQAEPLGLVNINA